MWIYQRWSAIFITLNMVHMHSVNEDCDKIAQIHSIRENTKVSQLVIPSLLLPPAYLLHTQCN